MNLTADWTCRSSTWNITTLTLCNGPLPSAWPVGILGIDASSNLLGSGGARVAPFTLNNFPTNLVALKLSNNSLSGQLTIPSFTQFPNLEVLSLENNYFTGDLFWVAAIVLPTKLRTLRLGGNSFTGTPSFQNIPPTMYTFDMSNNQFCGAMSLPKCFDNTFLGGMCSDGNGGYSDPSGIQPTNYNNTANVSFSCPRRPQPKPIKTRC